MRVLLVVASFLVACGPPEEPGEWAAISPTSVTVVNGHLYGFGQFFPKPGQHGAFGVLSVDAEALFIRDEDLVPPSKDLRKAQVREWNTDPFSLRGGGTNGLIAPTMTGFERYTLSNPKHPLLVDGGHVDAPAIDGVLSPVSGTVSVAASGLQAFLVNHESGVVATTTLPEPVCSEFMLTSGDRGVAVGSCGANENLLVLTLTESTIAVRSTRAMPEVTTYGGLAATSTGTIIAGDRGTKPSLHLYTLGPTDELLSPRSMPLADADKPTRLYAVGERVLLFTSTSVLLVDVAAMSIVSRVTVSEPVTDVQPYASKAEPSATFVALAHGEGGLSLLQVDGDTLVHRGGFFHRWTDQAITLLSARKY